MGMSKFFSKNKGERILYNEPFASSKIANELLPLLPQNKSTIVIVCIGTDRSTGDSLGPLVGTQLQEGRSIPFPIYGTLESPIHAVNLESELNLIKEMHDLPFIIAIDACLGSMKNVGTIQIGKGPLKPGAGVNKQLPEVGDIHITGVVNVSGFMEFFVLQNTRLSLVLNMAKTITKGIQKASLLFESDHRHLSVIENEIQKDSI